MSVFRIKKNFVFIGPMMHKMEIFYNSVKHTLCQLLKRKIKIQSFVFSSLMKQMRIWWYDVSIPNICSEMNQRCRNDINIEFEMFAFTQIVVCNLNKQNFKPGVLKWNIFENLTLIYSLIKDVAKEASNLHCIIKIDNQQKVSLKLFLY